MTRNELFDVVRAGVKTPDMDENAEALWAVAIVLADIGEALWDLADKFETTKIGK